MRDSSGWVLGGVSRWVATNDLVPAELWEAAQPLLPPEPCTTHGGPPRVPHRSALAGILYVLGDLDAIDWSRASLDSISTRAKRGWRAHGPQSHRPGQGRFEIPRAG